MCKELVKQLWAIDFWHLQRQFNAKRFEAPAPRVGLYETVIKRKFYCVKRQVPAAGCGTSTADVALVPARPMAPRKAACQE